MALSLPAGLVVTWLGHSTFLVRLPSGKTILIDPWTHGNPACPADRKDPGPIDLMLITHGHSDHMGDAVTLAQASSCTIACIYEIMLHLIGKGVDPSRFQPMNRGGSIALPALGLSLTQTLAFHSAGIDEDGQVFHGGDPAGFVVTLESGFAFYHAGDTALFSDMALIAALYRPTLAMLPIGDRFTMGPREAAHALRLLSTVEAVIPMHWGTFPLLTGTPAALAAEGKALGLSTQVLALQPGQSVPG